MTTTCARCGATLQIADYPFCPHGRSALAAHGDDIPGGMYFENGLPEGRYFYSHQEHEAAVRANGCEIAPHWVPNDKHLVNWAAGIDAKTLENARVLLSRTGPTREPELSPGAQRLARELAERLQW